MTDFYHDQARNLLIYDTVSPLVQQWIPDARQINGRHIALPRTLRNSQILRHLNFPVPPIMDGYDWPHHPSLKEPYDIQKTTANFFTLHPRSFCLSEMGTGKTLAALWAADWLMQQHPKGEFRALIVAPLSTLQRVWGDAIFKNFLARRSFTILHGSAEKRLELLAKPADLYIINFDGVGIGAHTRKRFELDGFSKALAERSDIRLAIVDEASGYRDARTKRHRIARLVIGKRPYVWMMTGTPTPNAPTDAYGLGKLVNNAFGKSFATFQSETMIKVSQFKWTPQRDGYEKARKLLTPAIRYDLTQVWDGPEMVTQLREVPLTPDQKTEMARLKRDLQIVVKSGAQISAVNEAAARTKLMQISLGAIYDEHHRVHLIDAAPRFAELKDIVDDAPAKLLLLAPLTSIVHIVQAHLNKWNAAAKKVGNEPRYSSEIVNGETSQNERNRIFSAFEEKEHPRILVADPGVLAHGLTLVAARTVVWFGVTDKAELYAQANRRAHRPGQKWPVSIVQVVSNPLEREIFRRLENNLSLQGVMLDLVKDGEL